MESENKEFSFEETELIKNFIAALRATADTLEEGITSEEKKTLLEILKARPEVQEILSRYKEEPAAETAADKAD